MPKLLQLNGHRIADYTEVLSGVVHRVYVDDAMIS
jgi:hypothetical protein